MREEVSMFAVGLMYAIVLGVVWTVSPALGALILFCTMWAVGSAYYGLNRKD